MLQGSTVTAWLRATALNLMQEGCFRFKPPARRVKTVNTHTAREDCGTLAPAVVARLRSSAPNRLRRISRERGTCSEHCTNKFIDLSSPFGGAGFQASRDESRGARRPTLACVGSLSVNERKSPFCARSSRGKGVWMLEVCDSGLSLLCVLRGWIVFNEASE